MAPSKTYSPDAGFPRDAPCTSFWTAHQSGSEFIGFRSTQDLPKETDVVISALSSKTPQDCCAVVQLVADNRSQSGLASQELLRRTLL